MASLEWASRRNELYFHLCLSVISHPHSGEVPPLPRFNMDVCSSFMAAVVTGRYTTSGHLTSLGIGVGVGAGAVKAELFYLRFFYSSRWWRMMEELATVQS